MRAAWLVFPVAGLGAIACNALLGNSDGNVAETPDASEVVVADSGIDAAPAEAGDLCGEENGCVFISDVLQPIALSADSTSIYFAAAAGNYGIAKCAKSGCSTPTEISQTKTATWLGVQGANVYWASGLSILTTPNDAPRSAVPSSVYVSDAAIAALAISNDNLIWATADTVSTCKLPACSAPRIVASGQKAISLLVGFEDEAYWRTENQVVYCSLLGAGCGANPASRVSAKVTSLAVVRTDDDAGNDLFSRRFYFIEGTTVSYCGAGACAIGKTNIGVSNSPFALTVHQSTVWWRDSDTGAILQCAFGGCGGTPTRIAEKQPGSQRQSMIASGDYLYWATPTEIRRRRIVSQP